MFSKGNVLVVDDEVNLCRILGAKLTKNGYSVVAVHDGVQAIEKVRERDFDIVLLDLILPKMDGLSALAEIRGMKHSLPVIIMSACENSDAIEQAMSTGASAYIKKPFDLDNLVNLVQNTSGGDTPEESRPTAGSSILFAKRQPITLDVAHSDGVISYRSHIEDKDEKTVSVLAPSVGESHLELAPKTAVRVGLAAPDAYYSFSSFVVSSKCNGKPILVLDKPGAICRTQRRQFPRRPLRTSAHYCRISRTGGQAEPLGRALALDVSVGGIKLALDELLTPGDVIYVEVDKAEDLGRVAAIGQVIRCNENQEPDSPAYVAGVKFSQVDEKVRQSLARA